MSGHIPARLARAARRRAKDICEYCRLPQAWQEAAFHLDHVIPRVDGGPTTLQNLALACVSCSLRKSARIRARDPQTGKFVPLFNPRRDRWPEHFSLNRRYVVQGRTAKGRATAAALGMNRPHLVDLRRQLAAIGEFPPP